MVNHQFLNHCWVCGAKFTSAGGTAIEERHHVIPVAYGGVDGPQVSLCDNHHHKLHRIAEKLGKGSYSTFLQGETPDSSKKLLYLATCVANARDEFRKDPNRHVLHTMMLTPVTKHKLDLLKKTLNVNSRNAVIEYAIDRLFRSIVTSSRKT